MWRTVEKHSANITVLGKHQPFPPLASGPNNVERGAGEADAFQRSVLLPRLGLLVVFLPPRILKKPFPKEERAFREPKLSSSMLAGNVADGPSGGFSLVLLVSSLVFWQRENISIPPCLFQAFVLKRQRGGRVKLNHGFLNFYLFIIAPFKLVLFVL